MRRLCCILLLASSAAVSSAADGPSETDLAAITYFAPVCPFYYRMMGPDGELREFQQLDEAHFKAPRGWSAEVVDGKVEVRAPGHRRFTYSDGRLVTYQRGRKKHTISYPFEPAYGGRPASLWGIEPGQMDRERMQKRLDRLTDIWSMTGRFSLWFRSPNAAVAFLAGVALVGAALFLSCGAVGLSVGLAAMLASLAGLALTGSRGGMLAFLAGFAVLIAASFLRRKGRPSWRRVLVLVGCLVLAGVFAVATQGSKRFTKGLVRAIEGRGEGRDRSALFAAGARMMADAPDGWGVRGAGPAYSHWYQSMGGDTWQMTLVSDHLTHLVGYGWAGRWLWTFGWFAAIALLWKFARRGFSSAGVAVWVSLFVAALFNVMLSQPAVWALPAVFAGLMAWRLCRGEWREWRGYLKWLGFGAAASVAAVAALYAVCAAVGPSSPRIRHAGGAVTVGEGEPSVWVVDDGETLGGLYTQNLIRRHYLTAPASNAVPASVYCRSLADVPGRVGRLVLAGRQGERFLALRRQGRAPSAGEIVFVSPPFGPKDFPADLLAGTRVGVLLGEFAARYVDVYGEGPLPKWVTLVKGAELYIPNWTDYAIGGGR
ncbi:MAG: O-antigen ligase family protein [Kiritimatiellae bacterium]|nr:O-antigen ligase family protein [Kiritimatiellia bacterium]